MAGKPEKAATNDLIVRLLEDVRSELADVRKRDERLASQLAQLLKRKTA